MSETPRLFKSILYAGRGLAKTWRQEGNFRFEGLATAVVFAVAWFLRFDATAFAILAVTCGLVLALEVVNTMIERLSDLLKPRLDHYVKEIKDLSAAAVFVGSLVSIIVGLCLFVPAFLRLF